MLQEFKELNWQYFLLILLAATIPCGINLLPFLALWLVLWVYTGGYKVFKLSAITFLQWLCLVFFALHVIGIFYSQNLPEAMSFTQAKIAFLLFPVFFNQYFPKRSELKTILLVFCFSNVLVSLYLEVRAMYYALILPEPVFTYSRFALFMHPSYASLFMVFSIALLFLGGYQLSQKQRNDLLIKSLASFILVVAILFCSSKIGFITLALLMVFLVGYFVLKMKLIGYASGFLAVLFFTSCIFIKEIPGPMNRMQNLLFVCENTDGANLLDIDEMKKRSKERSLKAQESTMARIFIWSSSIEVMHDNLYLGVGTGDVNDALLKSFEKNSLYGLLINKLNAHNQYVETQVALGLPGCILLIMLTAGVFLYALIRQKVLLCIFSLLFVMNLFVESYFQWQNPTVFFALFLFLLFDRQDQPHYADLQSGAGK